MSKSSFQGYASGQGFQPLKAPYDILARMEQQSSQTIRGLQQQQRQTDARAAKAEQGLERKFAREEKNLQEINRLEDTYFANRMRALEVNQKIAEQDLKTKLGDIKAESADAQALAKMAPKLAEQLITMKETRDENIQDAAYNHFISNGLPSDRMAAYNQANDLVAEDSENVHDFADALEQTGADPRVVSNYRQLSKNEELGRVKAYAKMAESSVQGFWDAQLAESGVDQNDPVAVAALAEKVFPEFLRANGLSERPDEMLNDLFLKMRGVRNSAIQKAEKGEIIVRDGARINDLNEAFLAYPSVETATQLFTGLSRYKGRDGTSGPGNGLTGLFTALENASISDSKVVEILQGMTTDNGQSMYDRHYNSRVRPLLEKRSDARIDRTQKRQQQLTVQHKELVSIGYQALQRDDDLTDVDVDTMLTELREKGVPERLLSSIKDLRAHNTIDAKQAKAIEEDLQELYDNGALTVDEVMQRNPPEAIRKKFLPLAEAADKARYAGGHTEKEVKASVKEKLKAVLGNTLPDENAIGLSLATGYAVRQYNQKFKYLVDSGIDPVKASLDALAAVEKDILDATGRYAVSDWTGQVPTGGSSKAKYKYFTRFVPKSAATPEGIDPSLTDVHTQRMQAEQALEKIKKDPELLSKIPMIPTAELFNTVEQIEAGKPHKIPPIYFEVARQLGPDVDAREAFNINAKSVKPHFDGGNITGSQQYLREQQGANDPQIQEGIRQIRSQIDVHRMQQAMVGNRQSQYMSDNVSHYTEAGPAKGAFIRGLTTQESRGDNSAVNRRTGAAGISQIHPDNIGPWTKKYYNRTLSHEQFLNNPAAQNAVTTGRVTDILKDLSSKGYRGEELIRRGYAIWYGGPGAVDHWNNPGYHANVPGEPNMQEYTQSAYQHFLNEGGFGQQPMHSGSNSGVQITSSRDPGEGGLDFVVAGGQRGAQFFSPFDATVVQVVTGKTAEIHLEKGEQGSGYGNYVDLRVTHPSGHVFDQRCAHFDNVNGSLKVGQTLKAGTFIGTQGRTGSTTGAHVSCDAYLPGTTTIDERGNALFSQYLRTVQ